MNVSPLYKIIALSTVLAAGFILIILSCALFNNWIPLSVVGLFLIAPIPNGICGQYQAHDDFMSESTNTIVDFGRFFTGFLVLSGVALPIVLAHNNIIGTPAMIMSLVGGSLIYLTIITFRSFFHEPEDF
ncbi:uncharacterized protein SAPINGB_P005576 [Magnusiomyces paraingens]|uniref:Vacuolar protein sorting-associated protein 55 n=1 Tax=Magnusiomyces paraingens TaxID=2606893 RepID=A0A5E8C0F2_9ASCO|nr:uncharacterized protein SAPINGB_P005576 [Saprochaete ingens]VVT57184.1 unnamed protein product [Saprochaete ingens]